MAVPGTLARARPAAGNRGVTLDRSVLTRVFFRSLWLQGLWTVQRGQNLGCLYSLWPVVDRLYERSEDRAEVARTHAGFFSTHPYTAGVVLGVVAGLETDRARGNGPSSESIAAARSAMSGPLAALGEAFFWSLWRPLSFLAALALALIHPGRPVRIALLFLIVYNVLHLGARWQGLRWGYRWRTAVVPRLEPLRLQRVLAAAAVAGAAGTVALAVAALAAGRASLALAGAAVAAAALLRRGVSLTALFVGSAVVALGWTLLGAYL